MFKKEKHVSELPETSISIARSFLKTMLIFTTLEELKPYIYIYIQVFNIQFLGTNMLDETAITRLENLSFLLL